MPPENEEETVLDAVNAALEDELAPESETSEPETEEEVVEGDEPEGEESESDEPEGEEGEETEEEPAKGPNGEKERNPDGTWKAKGAEPPKKDPINDPIPENLKKDTSERIRSLIDTAKTVTAERDQFKTDFDYLVNGVQATGATPQQYGETLSWLSLFNAGINGDGAQLEKAYELIETVAERCALLLGKDRNVQDQLAAHVDLQQAVQKGQITPEYAKEIARTRNGQQFRQQLSTTAQAEQEQQTAAATELATARSGLSQLEQTLIGTDPSYLAKKAILVPALKPVFASIPPSQWVQKFTEAYRNIKVGAPAAQPKGVPANQPLRAGKQPAGGQSRAPTSMLDALNGALNNMPGGK
jgi:hypothetical protein